MARPHRHPRPPNPIDVVEVAYDLTATDHEWLEQIVQHIEPLISDGAPLIAYQFDLRTPVADWFATPVVRRLARGALDELRRLILATGEHAKPMHRTAHVLVTLRAQLARAGGLPADVAAPVERIIEILDGIDTRAFTTVEPDGGVMICTGCVRHAGSTPAPAGCGAASRRTSPRGVGSVSPCATGATTRSTRS